MTAPSAEIAETIVGALVAEKLIACGNISRPVTSVYTWKGDTERTEEILVIMKTTALRVARVIERVIELHPYEVPELLSIPIDAGHTPYLQWVQESVAFSEESSA